MKCINCNKVISKTANYCSHCGFKVLPNEDISDNKDNKIDIEELSKKYIGKNYDNFNNNFSICFLIFGFYYLFYRKMWVHGIVWLLANITFFLMFPIAWLILYPVIKVVGACAFKMEYKNHVKNNINEIIASNPNINFEELKEKCEYEGGVVDIVIPIALVFNMLIYILILILAMLFHNIDKYKDNKKDNNSFYKYSERYKYY